MRVEREDGVVEVTGSTAEEIVRDYMEEADTRLVFDTAKQTLLLNDGAAVDVAKTLLLAFVSPVAAMAREDPVNQNYIIKLAIVGLLTLEKEILADKQSPSCVHHEEKPAGAQ